MDAALDGRQAALPLSSSGQTSSSPAPAGLARRRCCSQTQRPISSQAASPARRASPSADGLPGPARLVEHKSTRALLGARWLLPKKGAQGRAGEDGRRAELPRGPQTGAGRRSGGPASESTGTSGGGNLARVRRGLKGGRRAGGLWEGEAKGGGDSPDFGPLRVDAAGHRRGVGQAEGKGCREEDCGCCWRGLEGGGEGEWCAGRAGGERDEGRARAREMANSHLHSSGLCRSCWLRLSLSLLPLCRRAEGTLSQDSRLSAPGPASHPHTRLSAREREERERD